MLREMLDDMFAALPEEYSLTVLDCKDTRWHCDCSRERMKSALATIGKDDLRQIVPIEDAYDSVTVNGWVLEVLGHLPQPGDAFDYGELHVTVERVALRRVEQIRIHRRHTDET